MLPAKLSVSAFAGYPLEAQAFAKQNLAVLQQMPLSLAIILLREVVSYDWRFPIEKLALDSQFHWLRSLSIDHLKQVVAGFANLSVTDEVISQNWVSQPQQASEGLTAYLWSSHQMDQFHAAAAKYAESLHAAVSEPAPGFSRLCIVVLGQGVRAEDYPLFRKLRPHGVFVPQVEGPTDLQSVWNLVSDRIEAHPEPYQHWFIDGQMAELAIAERDPRMVHMSWPETGTLRAAILARMQQVTQSPQGGPEELRTLLATITPSTLGVPGGKDEVLSRFRLSLVTEGSGTQIFSTTFVQWAAREALRRAQPSTLLLRFGPRQRQLPMDELVAGVRNAVADPAGSMVDADMGAFYTWINQQRLTGAGQAKFVAWSQEHKQAIVIGAGLPRGTTANSAMSLKQLLAL